MEKDYAAQLTWEWLNKCSGGRMSWPDAIEGAIREALAKAADGIDDGTCVDLEKCKHRDCKPLVEAAAWVRYLGAKP